MTDYDDILRILREIVVLLRVLTAERRKLAEQRFANDVLTTAERRKMWQALNGERTSRSIAQTAGVTIRAAQMFIRELESRGLVTVREDGQAKIATPDPLAILEHYCDMPAGSLNTEDGGPDSSDW